MVTNSLVKPNRPVMRIAAGLSIVASISVLISAPSGLLPAAVGSRWEPSA